MTIVGHLDWEKYFLGKLCKRSHDWDNTGKSLRRISCKHCLLCEGVKNFGGTLSKEEFWSKVLKDENGCWEWLGYINPYGYGIAGFRTKLWPAHRLAWFFTYGDIPTGLKICHKCDNRKCVRIDHLWLGTQADNVADMIAKNRKRSLPGEQNPKAKLTEKDVLQIRVLGQEKGIHPEVIAKQFGVTRTAISYILQGKSWKHI